MPVRQTKGSAELMGFYTIIHDAGNMRAPDSSEPVCVKLAEAQVGTVATSTATTSEMKQHAMMQLPWVALISRLLKIIGLFCKKAL